MTIEQALSRYVAAPNGCWLWYGATSRGYGVAQIKGDRIRLVHRLALEHRLGRPIADGMFACHHCDTPGCIRPEHIFEASPAENMEDASKKRRTTFGERSGMAKLTAAQVAEIRNSKESDRALGRRYGVHGVTVWEARTGATWKHLS